MAQKQKINQIIHGGLGRPHTVIFTVFCCCIFTCLSTSDAQRVSSSLKTLGTESYPEPRATIMRSSPPLSVLLRMRDRAATLNKKSLAPLHKLPSESDVIHFQNEVLKVKENQVGVIGPSGQVQPPVGPIFPQGPIGSVRAKSVKKVEGPVSSPAEQIRSINPVMSEKVIGPSGPVLRPPWPVLPPGPVGPVKPIDPVRSINRDLLIGPSGPVLRPEGPVFPGGPIGPIKSNGAQEIEGPDFRE